MPRARTLIVCCVCSKTMKYYVCAFCHYLVLLSHHLVGEWFKLGEEVFVKFGGYGYDKGYA
jgi:hypothetical protein